jgi:hypothetical protein
VDQWIRSPEFVDAVLPTLGIRFALLVFAPIALILLGDAGARASVPLNLWNAWDAPHYLEVARLGYDPAGDPARSVLFPLLPLLLRVGLVFLPGLIAGLVISVVATVAAAVGIYRLARLDGAIAAGRSRRRHGHEHLPDRLFSGASVHGAAIHRARRLVVPPCSAARLGWAPGSWACSRVSHGCPASSSCRRFCWSSGDAPEARGCWRCS